MVRRRIIRIGIIALSCAAIAFGVIFGEAQTVLQKAIHICLECIGIG